MKKLTFETLGGNIYVYLKMDNKKFVYCNYMVYECWIQVDKNNEAIYESIMFKSDFHEKYNI